MSGQRDYYEVLGVPRTASQADIKKKFRELVHKHHPDVVSDKTAGQKTFVEITEAYKILVDPIKRRSYDMTLPSITETVETRTVVPGANRISSPPGAKSARRQPVNPMVARIIKEAELAFIRRRLGQASELAKQAIGIDMTCARAHAILGDVYRAHHKHEFAINEYSFAVQYDPADQPSRDKLEKLLDHSAPITFSWENPIFRMSKQVLGLNIIGWGLVILIQLLIYIYPGEPIRFLVDLNTQFLKHWSWNLVLFIFGDAALAGFLMGANGMLNHPDEELVFETSTGTRAIFPTGFLLMVFAPFFYLGAAALYLFFAALQDVMSKSVLKVLLMVTAITFISALMYPKDSVSVMLFGGNVAFVGALVGWYMGALFHPER